MSENATNINLDSNKQMILKNTVLWILFFQKTNSFEN